jgi:hypothetical protein
MSFLVVRSSKVIVLSSQPQTYETGSAVIDPPIDHIRVRHCITSITATAPHIHARFQRENVLSLFHLISIHELSAARNTKLRRYQRVLLAFRTRRLVHCSADRAPSLVRTPHLVQLINQAVPLSARGRSLTACLLSHASASPVRDRRARRCAGCGPGCRGRVGSGAAGSACVSRPGAGAQRVGSGVVISGGLVLGERRGSGGSGAP